MIGIIMIVSLLYHLNWNNKPQSEALSQTWENSGLQDFLKGILCKISLRNSLAVYGCLTMSYGTCSLLCKIGCLSCSKPGVLNQGLYKILVGFTQAKQYIEDPQQYISKVSENILLLMYLQQETDFFLYCFTQFNLNTRNFVGSFHKTSF